MGPISAVTCQAMRSEIRVQSDKNARLIFSIYASVDADVYSILRIHNYLCIAQSITYKNHTHPPIEPSNIVHKLLPSCSPKEH